MHMATFDITESNGSQNSKLLDFSWFVKSEKIPSDIINLKPLVAFSEIATT